MGRPKGSKNKRTLGVPAHLARELGHRDPAEVLADVYSMPLDDLKRLMRSKVGQAAVAAKIRAAEAAMPYRHSKMPIAMTVNDERLPTLVIVRGVNQIEQIQRLMKDITPRVAGLPVAAEAQPADTKGKSDD